MPIGGKRPGAGRPRNNPPTRSYTIRMTEEQHKLLSMWGRGSASDGLRWLINTARRFISKVEEKVELPND